MQIAIDLHSHSAYAGGVGQVHLKDLANTMRQKGILVFGTGDSLHPDRVSELRSSLVESEEGLYQLTEYSARFLLQTEVIFTVSLPDHKNKIVAHHLLLFPNFDAIDKVQFLLKQWNQKNTIGRPFIVCQNQRELEDRLFAIQAVHPLIEVIPAHIMTPDGIMGSKNQLESLSEYYGQFLPYIRIVETGLSATPAMLASIPEVNLRTMISNSDSHSAALNRLGREFTIIDSQTSTYPAIINALRANQVTLTAEFNPAEGRYYSTGHRADRPGHTEAWLLPPDAPFSETCPMCGKPVAMGVAQRCQQLSTVASLSVKPFISLIPLIEVIALAMTTKSLTSPKILAIYNKILDCFPNEISLWMSEPDIIAERISDTVPLPVLSAILSIRDANFSFDPPGFDGQYGQFRLS